MSLLEGLTVTDLDEVIAEAERRRETRRESGKKELVGKFTAKAKAMGLSLAELLEGSAQTGSSAPKPCKPQKGAAAAPSPVKYRNPDKGETRSGRGRMPKSMALVGEQGRDREEFLAKG